MSRLYKYGLFFGKPRKRVDEFICNLFNAYSVAIHFDSFKLGKSEEFYDGVHESYWFGWICFYRYRPYRKGDM